MKSLELQENLKKFSCIDKCPIRNVIAQFSGKWQMLVLCVLAENGKTRFNAIGKAIPDISPKVLADTLKNLEADGYVIRKMYAEIPPKVEYSLSELGQSLMEVIGNLINWATSHYKEIEANRKSNKR